MTLFAGPPLRRQASVLRLKPVGALLRPGQELLHPDIEVVEGIPENALEVRHEHLAVVAQQDFPELLFGHAFDRTARRGFPDPPRVRAD
jgi:hypothetical protein